MNVLLKFNDSICYFQEITHYFFFKSTTKTEKKLNIK